jgi:hypothetical protein
MSDTEDPAIISTVSMKLPTFWHKNPRFWFSQAESQFALARITTELTRFHHVVRALDVNTAEQVMQLIENPRTQHEYRDLKAALVTAYDKPRRERAARLADMGGLGDRKPSHLLNEMKALLGGDPSNLLFEHHFLLNLPDEIRIALSQQDYTSLDELAQAADKMWREKTITMSGAGQMTMAAVKRTENPKKTAYVKTTTTEDGICYFHHRFGSQAKNCKGPCKFASGNANAGQ